MHYQWAPYVPVAERRRKAAGEMAKLAKKGQAISPVVVQGRAIAATAWGKAWCANMESYSDYANRLPRGRTYLRNGSVIDLEIAAGTETEYDRLHREIWPEMAAAIRDAGYRNYSLFRRGTEVICYCECIPDAASCAARMTERHAEVRARWNVLMEPFIVRMADDDGRLREYPLAWHLEDE